VNGFYEFRFWSPVSGCEMARISMCDARAQEFFMHIEAGEGKAWRERRTKAVEAILEAMRQGLNPGEVRLQ